MPRSWRSHWLGACKDAARCSLRALLTTGAALGLLAAAYAAGLGLKPGLWDVRLVRQVVDGHDVSQQLTESIAKAQAALASLPPAQRARVESMLNAAGVNPGSNASFRICVSPEMAANDLPMLDQNGRCRPQLLSRNGARTSFRIDCTANGTHMQGQGDAVSSGDVITTHANVTTRAADGSTHSMQNEMQMHYLSADCGSLRPPH
ncbi:MAG TPA: DUF3617 domain-containing protein [Steroidobacteraceae bacterium]|nr:DUF3617 domain-containing protein [Steroidobacteraceae bacterium]